VNAVFLRAVIDLAVRGSVLAVRSLRPAPSPAAIRLEASNA
jgi:hypothetical protein